jgi:predicted NBD/HSP70 family sugar kinase
MQQTTQKAARQATIGIDIGGTTMDAVAINEAGKIIASDVVHTHKGTDALQSGLRRLIDSLRESCSLASLTVAGIGIGVPGKVNHAKGSISDALNLGVNFFDFRKFLDSYRVPVNVENDVNAAAVAAAQTFGKKGTVVFLNMGTGLASGVVINGRIDRGISGAAGEIGHIPMDPQALRCTCGQRGCLETIASGSGIARRWGTHAKYPVKDLFDHAAQGDVTAQHIQYDLFWGAARAIQLIAQTFDPAIIALGGGVSNMGEPLLKGILTELDRFSSESAFIRSLNIPERLTTTTHLQHLGALGAGVAAQPQTQLNA